MKQRTVFARAEYKNMTWYTLYKTANIPALGDVRKPKEDVNEVMEANMSHGIVSGNQTVPIDSLNGGVRIEDPRESARVKALAAQMSSPGGYFERIIVDDQNNVVEGQHRLEALRMLGVTQVPIVRITDMSNSYDMEAMRQAAMQAKQMRSDHVHYIVQRAMEAIKDSGSPEQALADQQMHPDWAAPFQAALRAATKPQQATQ